MLNKALAIFLLFQWVSCVTKPPISNAHSEKKDWWLWAAAWHPSGDQVAVGGTQDTLRLFSTNEFRLLKNIPIKGTITKIKWHPEGDLLAFSLQGVESGTSIYDLESGRRTVLDSVVGFGARGLDWNSDGTLLAVGDYEGVIRIFSKEGKWLKSIDTHQKAIIGLDWHPSQEVIVAVGEKISLYDFKNDSIDHIEDRIEDVLMLCVEWHPSGHQFVTADYGDHVHHYPPLLQSWTANGVRSKKMEGSKAEYRNLKWSSDGKLLVTASEKLRLWDSSANLVLEQPVDNLLWGIDWNSDDSKLVTTDEKGRIYIWDRNLNKLGELTY